MNIIYPPEGSEHVTVTESSRSITLSYGSSDDIVISTMKRPANYFETVYLVDGNFDFIPDEQNVLAAHYTQNGTDATLTLFALEKPAEPIVNTVDTHIDGEQPTAA